MTVNGEPSDLDVVRNAAALQCRSLFGARTLAANAQIGPAALEKWVFGHARLAPEAMQRIVKVLFHGCAAWDAERGVLVDIEKPATLSHSPRDNAPGL